TFTPGTDHVAEVMLGRIDANYEWLKDKAMGRIRYRTGSGVQRGSDPSANRITLENCQHDVRSGGTPGPCHAHTPEMRHSRSAIAVRWVADSRPRSGLASTCTCRMKGSSRQRCD